MNIYRVKLLLAQNGRSECCFLCVFFVLSSIMTDPQLKSNLNYQKVQYFPLTRTVFKYSSKVIVLIHLLQLLSDVSKNGLKLRQQ